MDFSLWIENAAYRSLTEEVSVTPKPGLVDLWDTGAHQDMDYRTFLVSAAAIAPYMGEMAELGRRRWRNAERIFEEARAAGTEAERSMFRATGGINTHKGAVFLLGILCMAAGMVYEKYGFLKKERIFLTAAGAAGPCLTKEMKRILSGTAETHGEKLLVQYGVTGIRGEVQKAFPSLRYYGMPALRKGEAESWGRNERNMYILLALMANVDDTNVLSRTGIQGLFYMRKRAERVLKKLDHPDRFQREMLIMNYEFMERNISPGGCADLLAATILTDEMEKAWGSCSRRRMAGF
ncbi:triphosphoribosyl-dephospho-CoA synthase [Clostridium sp. AM58-1XD]|uniref:triphosphoribosyl-dephospho-CoA synthase n=1 Tax=Clostridium sp. AM58-1XD TaxID=2292307 RepID=UPI000E530868|nr:triphosphoribosyl-dephospho-CoA synthase [Clostridium sp. AM58-1XD]RGY97237.1 triphosphoribosyl-dephospho-CoA synthase [Clostridium sp. AM58-1XD]